MVQLIGYVLQLESKYGLDEDKIRENLYAIPGVTNIDFYPSYWGSPCVWTVTFEPPEKWKGLVDTQRRLDRAVKVRKAKKDSISQTFGDWVDAHQRQMHDEMMAAGGPFSNVTFIAK